MQYSTAEYLHMKQTTAHTWPEMILPGCSRACFFCGQICTRGKKEINAALVAEMLSEQHEIATDIMHATMQNLLQHAIQAHEQCTSHRHSDDTCIVSCTCCLNWISHRRCKMPFLTPVQCLRWYMNSLQPIFPKKMDLRVITGVCQRLTCRHQHKTNYYLTLFTPAEQDAICKTAMLCNKTAKLKVEWPIVAYYFDSIKRSPVIGSLAVSNKIRQFLAHDDCRTQNIFPAPTGNDTKETLNVSDGVYTSGRSESYGSAAFCKFLLAAL
jgi:hypothetical protein